MADADYYHVLKNAVDTLRGALGDGRSQNVDENGHVPEDDTLIRLVIIAAIDIKPVITTKILNELMAQR